MKEVSPLRHSESVFLRFQLVSRRSAAGFFFAAFSTALLYRFGAQRASIVFYAALFLLLGVIRIDLSRKAQLPILVLTLLCAGVAGYCLTQSALDVPFSYVTFDKKLYGILIVAIVLVLFLLLTARPFAAVCLGLVLVLCLATVDDYVFRFRGSELIPADFLSVATAWSVASKYDFTPGLTVVRAWLNLLLFLFALSALHLPKLSRSLLTVVSVPLLTLMTFSLLHGVQLYSPSHWSQDGRYLDGFLFNFVLTMKQTFVRKPQGYNPEALKTLHVDISLDDCAASPSIIVIMNESFADLRVVGSHFRTDEEVMPFFRSLTENTVKGYACASVFGGGTANSEFEFLTGHTMAFLPSGSVPYQQYLRGKVCSMASVLKSRGYSCVAMTPFSGRDWNIQNAYPCLGFEELHFEQELGELPTVRDRTSDLGMYEYIIRYYEQRDKDRPLFLLGVTMQNHGGYFYDNELFPARFHLVGYEQNYPDVEQYLTLIHESDAALARLVEYFSTVDEDVVLVFFGDHLPSLDRSFYLQTHDNPNDNLDEAEKEYMIPYLIWTNYASASRNPPPTSLNYLGSEVYTAAGLPLPPYNQLLLQYQQRIPAINAYGYYSKASGHFLALSDASDEEAAILRQYEQLEYNALFDTENRLPMFSAK